LRWPASKSHECVTIPATVELDEVLISVWRQSLVDGASTVEIDGHSFPVQTTSRRRLRQIDFRWGDIRLRGLEQNPETKSRWAAQARAGKRVMQFLDAGRYIAVVVDGKVHTYNSSPPS
jgi:hypothetical protein